MTHRRQTIRTLAIALLTGQTNAGARVYDSQMKPITKETTFPLINVYTMGDRSDPPYNTHGKKYQNYTALNIEAIVKLNVDGETLSDGTVSAPGPNRVFRIADRYTVFRDGQMAGEGLIAEASEDDLVRMMVGRDVPASRRGTRARGIESPAPRDRDRRGAGTWSGSGEHAVGGAHAAFEQMQEAAIVGLKFWLRQQEREFATRDAASLTSSDAFPRRRFSSRVRGRAAPNAAPRASPMAPITANITIAVVKIPARTSRSSAITVK